jgi:hypothetical protein
VGFQKDWLLLVQFVNFLGPPIRRRPLHHLRGPGPQPLIAKFGAPLPVPLGYFPTYRASFLSRVPSLTTSGNIPFQSVLLPSLYVRRLRLPCSRGRRPLAIPKRTGPRRVCRLCVAALKCLRTSHRRRPAATKLGTRLPCTQLPD